MRLLVTILVALVALAALWSGGWYALAGWAERNVDGALAEAAARGVEVDCPGRRIGGFPFALRLTCGETAVSERQSGMRASLAGLSGGASIFRPATAEVALASPARIESPLVSEPAEFAWSDAELGIGMGMSGPRSVSFEATDLSGNLPLEGFPGTTVGAAHAEAALSPSGDGGTDASFAFTDLALVLPGLTLPPFEGRGSATLSAPPRALMSGRAALQTPIAARAIDVTLASGEARLRATGEVAVDAEGVVDGAIALTAAGTEALQAFIAALPPQHQQMGNAIAGAILAFGKPTTLDGDAASELTIEIVRGEATVGPVTLTLPRLRI